jgi:hypothetical protein
MIQPGGELPGAIDSKSSVHGSGRATRARASPEIAPAVALMTPACSKAPSGVTVPLRPASVQVTPAAGPSSRPCLSNVRAFSFTACPGLSTSSVGDTCSHAGSPWPAIAGSLTVRPVGRVAAFGPIA